MAKCLPMMGDMSGSMGGCTWSRNKGGLYIKRRPIPTNPNTTAQTRIRADFAQASGAWSSVLTGAERAQWNVWAASNPIVDTLGQIIQLSGQQAFVRFATRLLNAGVAYPTTPPVNTAPAGLDPATLVVNEVGSTGLITVTFAPTPLPADIAIQIWSSPPHNAGVHPSFRGAKLIHTSAAAHVSPVTTVGYLGSTGDAITIWVNTMSVDGQVSPALRSDLTMT